LGKHRLAQFGGDRLLRDIEDDGLIDRLHPSEPPGIALDQKNGLLSKMSVRIPSAAGWQTIDYLEPLVDHLGFDRSGRNSASFRSPRVTDAVPRSKVLR
jgi:hypothetical protein